MNLLVVEDAAEHGARLLSAEVGAWPLPERLWFVTVIDYPEMKWPCADLAEVDGIAAFWLGMDRELSVTPVVQRSASQLTDEDMETMTHVARGAVYSPEMEGE